MGTSGWFAYRYKGIYYREFHKRLAEPSQLGLDIACRVPKDPVEREVYKIETIATIAKDASKYSVTSDNSWMVPAKSTQWTYLINFDNDAFTVNGTVHFRLDNMPTGQQDAGTASEFVRYFNSDIPWPIPTEFLASISYWDPPHFDIGKAQELYHDFQSIVVPFNDWGAPTWDTLSVAQHLSTCLIRTLVADHSEELSLAAFRHMQRQLGLFTWQLTSVAASSNATCPPEGVTPANDVLHVRANLDEEPTKAQPLLFAFVEGRGFRNRFSRFRGCLIMFCIRLDEPAYMMYEVGRLAQRLSNRGSGVGIAISSWQMAAVAVDDTIVRHSPVLNLHDGKQELSEGALLLMHLLRPTMYSSATFSKSPWCSQVSALTHTTNEAPCRLPEDILRHIVHLTDYNTFLTLPQVSHLFYSIYLSHPRVGHYTLLGKHPGSNNIFKVRDVTSSSRIVAALSRVKASKNSCYNSNSYKQTQPLWRYKPKQCQRSILRGDLAKTFQHHQTGSGTLAQLYKAVDKYEDQLGLNFQNIATGRPPKTVGNAMGERFPRLPSLRIQVVDGLWEMIAVGSRKERWFENKLSKLPNESPVSYYYDMIEDYVTINSDRHTNDSREGDLEATVSASQIQPNDSVSVEL